MINDGVTQTASNPEKISATTEKAYGLSTDEAGRLQQQYGQNCLPEQTPTPLYLRFAEQFRDPLIYILLCAFFIDIILWLYHEESGWPIEGIAIAFILILNAGLGVWQEAKAQVALQKLKSMATSMVWVKRDGQLCHLPVVELVPGDIFRIEAGDRIPADADQISHEELLVDESIITGESLPVAKFTESELYSGSLIVRGKAYAKVGQIGSASTMGKLANLLVEIVEEKTPLEIRLHHFGKKIGFIVISLAAILVVSGTWLEGISAFNQIFLFAIALAVAAVPEGLPTVISLTLALGTERMAKHNTIVRRLAAVEALGSVTVIATDKTGTLTENQMLVQDIVISDKDRCFKAMALANDAEVETGAGDALELGLYDYLIKQGISAKKLQQQYPRVSTRPFDSLKKYMRVTVEDAGQRTSYIKGAPEVILARSKLTDKEKDEWQGKSEYYACQGFRLLAVAWGEGETEQELNFSGLILFGDPPRKEVRGAIKEAQNAGIRVLMITGDHPATALNIAQQIGIIKKGHASGVVTGDQMDDSDEASLAEIVRENAVFARVKPEHKLAIVETLQSHNQVVAVTGDGVNDAPALKAADVGVAMGIRGSDVSREVADLIIMDDNFATIVTAIKEGRNIFENIKKFIRFLFAANLAEVLLVTIGVIISMLLDYRYIDGSLLLPLTAVQILWINLLTDSFPALALALDKNLGVMNWKPMKRESPLLDKTTIVFILCIGSLGGCISLMLLYLLPAYGVNFESTQTVVFTYLTIGQLLFVFPVRRLMCNAENNPYVFYAIILGILLQVIALTTPGLNNLLSVIPLNMELISLILIVCFVSWLSGELIGRLISRSSLRVQT